MAKVDRPSDHLQLVWDRVESKIDAVEQKLPKGGDGPTLPPMDPWQTAINRLEDKVDSHLKWLLIAFASGFVLLAGLVINRTDALAAKIDAVGERVGGQAERLSAVEAKAAGASWGQTDPIVAPAPSPK